VKREYLGFEIKRYLISFTISEGFEFLLYDFIGIFFKASVIWWILIPQNKKISINSYYQ